MENEMGDKLGSGHDAGGVVMVDSTAVPIPEEDDRERGRGGTGGDEDVSALRSCPGGDVHLLPPSVR
jgi:hypothetical protein